MLASPSLFIILPDVNEAIITPIVSTIEGVMLFTFKRYFLDIPYSEKKDHTKKICEIYMLLTRVGITQGRWDSLWKYFRKFPTECKPLAGQLVKKWVEEKQAVQIYEEQLKDHPAYLYYDRALEHLKRKKYRHIYKRWENTKNLLDELNGKTSIEERLEGVIKEKMHRYFPALQSSTSVIESSDHYNPDNIMQFVMKYFRDQDNFSKYALDSLACGKSVEDKIVYSEWSSVNFHIVVRSDGEIDFETYKKLVKEMQEDGCNRLG